MHLKSLLLQILYHWWKRVKAIVPQPLQTGSELWELEGGFVIFRSPITVARLYSILRSPEPLTVKFLQMFELWLENEDSP